MLKRPPQPSATAPAARDGNAPDPLKARVMKLNACLTPREQRRLAAMMGQHAGRKPRN